MEETIVSEGGNLSVVVEKTVKQYGSGAHILIGKKYAGKLARVIIPLDVVNIS